MVQWEYKTIAIKVKMKNLMGGYEPDAQLNEMGAQGWELVQIVGMISGTSSGTHAVFKRPRE